MYSVARDVLSNDNLYGAEPAPMSMQILVWPAMWLLASLIS
jgi:hypothetical protein